MSEQQECLVLESNQEHFETKLSAKEESISPGLETMAVDLKESDVTADYQQQQLYTHLPAQVSLSSELDIKLERQDSYDSVGSLDEEGIQADQVPEVEESGEKYPKELEPRSERSSSVVSDASEEGGRDSGIEAEKEPDMVIPDENLINRIITQVEAYFSDDHVIKDKFLLKHIRRNKEGFVSLKLVSSFKKVKQLTKDWRVVAYSLNKASAKLQVNDLGTKLRRVDPLPEIDDTPVTCAVLALSLPLEKPGIENVSQLFSSCGDISFIRILRAGGTLPQDIKPLVGKYPALSDTHCAWIEFETTEAAKKASELSFESSMKVIPVLPESPKQEKQIQKKNQQLPANRKKSINNNKNSNNSSSQQQGQNSRKNSFSANFRRDRGFSNEYRDDVRRQRKKAISLPSTQTPNLRELSDIAEQRKFRPKSKSCTEFSSHSSPPTSWVQRNLLAAAAASAASAASPTVGSRPNAGKSGRISQGSLTLTEGVLRFPKGPDGTKGFGFNRRCTTEVRAST